MNTPIRSGTDKTTMTQIPPGILRAYLDDDPSLDAAARAHVTLALATDPATVACLEELRATRAAVNSAFAPLAAPPPTAAAVDYAYRCMQRTQRRTASAPLASFSLWNIGFAIKEYFAAMTTPTGPFGSTRVRRFALLSGVGALAIALLVAFAPVGDLASAALGLFRYQPDKFAVITFRQSDFGNAGGTLGAHTGAMPGGKDMGTKPAGPFGNRPAGAIGTKPAGAPDAENAQAFGELSKYVNVTSSLKQGQLPARPVKTAADAQAVTGRAAVAPTFLPNGVPNQPIYYVSDAQKVDATIDLKALRPALAANGVDGVLPATGDTATVHVDVPTASITSYGINPATLAMNNGAATAANQKGIVVVAMGTPSVDVQGLDVNALANTLASMPGVPPELVAQLRSADLNHTLVIPVTDAQTVKNGTFINGNASTLIAQKDGSGAVAMWFNRGILYIVAGTYDGSTIEKVAQSVK